MSTSSRRTPTIGQVDIDSPYALTSDAPAQFERAGFIRLPGVCRSVTSPKPRCRTPSGQGFPISTEPYALAEVSYHMGWSFHHAGQNRTSIPRCAMTITYIDADITVAEPTNDDQRIDLDAFMPGAQPGQVPDTPLNPVLYRGDGLWRRPPLR